MGDAEKTSSFAGEAPKKKAITQFSHWARPKSTLYEYNYDYGSYYYRPMIDYLNQKSAGGTAEVIKPMFWEERALKSYMDRARRVTISGSRVNKDTILLQNIRNSNSHYVAHSKSYAKKITGLGF